MKAQKEFSAKPLLYVALGNSLTLGVGAGYSPGFIQRYKRLAELALQRPVHGRVFARSGATSAEIANFITNCQVKQAVQHASIITVSAGGNDLILAARYYLRTKDQSMLEKALSQSRESIAKLLKAITAIKATQNQPYIVRLIGLYNPLPELDIGDKWIQAYNRQLTGFTNRNIKVANVFSAFKGHEHKLISHDRTHPNAEGYQVIAEQLNQLGYTQLI